MAAQDSVGLEAFGWGGEVLSRPAETHRGGLPTSTPRLAEAQPPAQAENRQEPVDDWAKSLASHTRRGKAR